MMEATYRKMPGRGATLMARYRLWRAEDHLLLVKQIGFSEEFKRIYFADIQVVVIERTPVYQVVTSILGLGVLFSLLLSFGVHGAAAMGVWRGLAGVLVVVLVVHLLMGATVKCMIQTRVNTHRLMMYRRWRPAARFMETVRPEIEKVQGVFSREEMAQEASRPS